VETATMHSGSRCSWIKMAAVEGEPESGPEQEAEVPAGDQACIGAAIQYRREFVGMVSEPLMDLSRVSPTWTHSWWSISAIGETWSIR